MPETDKMNFTTAVRHALIDKQWSVQELAVHIARPQSTVSRAIHGTRFPMVRKQIMKALGIKAAQLIAD